VKEIKFEFDTVDKLTWRTLERREKIFRSKNMSEMRDYKSRLSDPASRKFGTFPIRRDDAGAHPEAGRVHRRARLTPALEHRAGHLMDDYWYMWKLPLFGETDVTASSQRPRPATKPIRTTMCAWSATTS
jgi:hypothetical protein